MKSHIRKNLLKNRLKNYLGRRLEETVKSVMDSILKDKVENNLKYKVEAHLQQTQKAVVRTMRISYVDLFDTELEASQYVTTFFNTYASAAIQKYLYKKNYYRTPNDGVIYIPNAEITTYYANGGVFAFDYKDVHYFWSFVDEMYYDVYRRAYNPHGDINIFASTPRYIKEAYKHLLKVRIKHPTAYLSHMYRYGADEMFIENKNIYGTWTSTSGSYYDDTKDFNTNNFPEVGLGEGMIPFWGSGKSFMHNMEDEDYWSATFNAGMFVSDVFLANSIRKGLGKAIMSKGLYGGTKRYFGIGMSHTYGASVSRWEKLGLSMGSGGSKDHWLLTQKLMEKYEWLKPIGNQTWNLKKFSSQASHMRWGHGTKYGMQKAIPYWRFTYPITATPTWFKAGVVSGGLRGIEYHDRDE